MAANVSNISAGRETPATPDGRRSGMPLSDAASPSFGCDAKGPTAFLRSVAAPDYRRALGGNVINMKFEPEFFRSEAGAGRFGALTRFFVKHRIPELQFNFTGSATLLAARREPEKHRDLVVRTTVFLKGCPLRCRWCHNPEGCRSEPELLFTAARCVGCGGCLRACPRGAHVILDGGHRFDREKCAACGECAAACPTRALEMAGWRAGVAEVLAEVLRDRDFYGFSGGGLTLSGGEPTAQQDFAAALLAAAQAEGIATAVETCGWCNSGFLERLQPLVDLFLFDLKADPGRHRALTGADVGPILANLRQLHDSGANLWLRLPMVAGLNDTDEHFRVIAGVVRDLPGLERVQLLPCHLMASGKYRALGLANPLPAGPGAPSDDTVGEWLDRLRSSGVDAQLAD
jgi:pyruvate formate lyase activating enzyme